MYECLWKAQTFDKNRLQNLLNILLFSILVTQQQYERKSIPHIKV